jgi:hypothetical protein
MELADALGWESRKNIFLDDKLVGLRGADGLQQGKRDDYQ